jgi:hypothetical protein
MRDGSEVVIGPCESGAKAAALFLPCSQPWVFTLIQADGTAVFLSHVTIFGRADDKFGDKFDTTSKVLYYEKRAGGVHYIMIPDPTNAKKEGSYTRIKLPKQPSAKETPPTASDNIAAMCASGKLSAEMQAKYCKTN